jgi:hypothetical protein
MCQCPLTAAERVFLYDSEREFIATTQHLAKYVAVLPYKSWGLCPEHDERLRKQAIIWAHKRLTKGEQ